MSSSAGASYATTRLKVRVEADLATLEHLVTKVVTYRYFKVARTAEGHAQYFLGDEIFKSRKRGNCSKLRLPFVKAHTAIWILTDELEQKAYAIVERNLRGNKTLPCS